LKVMLEAHKLTKAFGGLFAVNDLDFHVNESEILGLLGPNGAGKTTLFNLISGFFPATGGEVIFEGEEITGLKAHEIAQRGVTRTFQTSSLFMRLSVLENVFSGYHMSYSTSLLKRLFRMPSAKKEEDLLREKSMKILEFMGMGSLKNEIAENLPHGHQRILGVCMALATKPKLLLLDEPVAGMNPGETSTMIELIRQIREKGITIVIVEHDMKTILRLCDRIVALSYGRKIAEGLPNEVMENEDLIEAYLGKEEPESNDATD